jgi:hypothetical protein
LNSAPIVNARPFTAEALLPIRSPIFKALQPLAAPSRSCASCSAVQVLLEFRHMNGNGLVRKKFTP